MDLLPAYFILHQGFMAFILIHMPLAVESKKWAKEAILVDTFNNYKSPVVNRDSLSAVPVLFTIPYLFMACKLKVHQYNENL